MGQGPGLAGSVDGLSRTLVDFPVLPERERKSWRQAPKGLSELPRMPFRVRHPWVWAASQTFAGAAIFVVLFTLTLYGLQEVLSWSD